MSVIDHLVYAVPQLEPAIEAVERSVGVRPAFGGSHTGMGTHNALVSLGSSYLELIAPDPGQPEPPQPRPFGIDELDHASLVTFAIRPDDGDDIDALVARATAAGYDPGPILDMSRSTTDGDVLRWRLTFPRPEFGGLVPFVIDWGDTPRPNDTSPQGVQLTSLTIGDADETTVAACDALGFAAVGGAEGDARSLSAVLTGQNGAMTLDSR